VLKSPGGRYWSLPGGTVRAARTAADDGSSLGVGATRGPPPSCAFPSSLLLWLGMLGYGAYNYAYYMLGAALNAFFPLYIVSLVLSVVTLILMLSRIDAGDAAASFRAKTPVRIVGGYLVFVAVGLTSAWMGMWAAYVFAGQPTPIEPEAFKLVAALDTTIMVPGLTLGGVLLWRRNAWGYIVAGIQGSLYLLVLSINSAVAILRGLAEAPSELPLWGTLAVTTTAVTLLLLANVRGRWEPCPDDP
jgi:hypothetical protein